MDAATAAHLKSVRVRVRTVRAGTVNAKHRDNLKQAETILDRLLGETPTFGASHAERARGEERLHNLGE